VDTCKKQEKCLKTLKAGAAKVDITPPLGLEMAGSFKRRVATGVHDKLYAKALVLDNGKKKIVIVACDLLALKRSYTNRACELIEKESGISWNDIMIITSHSHCGPQTTTLFGYKRDEQYMEDLVQKISKTVTLANNRLSEAKIGIGTAEIDDISFNSRLKLKDGSIAWWGHGEDEILGPTGPIDPEIGIVYVKNSKDEVIAVLYNFSCHANTLDISEYSADYPGYASRIIEEKTGGIALFSPGACGNIHPVYELGVEKIGEKLATRILKVLGSIKLNSRAEIGSIKQEIKLPLRKFEQTSIDEIRKTMWRKGVSEEERQRIEDFYLKGPAYLKGMEEKEIATIIQVLLVDQALLVGIPGELFTEFGLQIKKESSCRHTLIFELANDWVGYIPTPKAFEEGGYQVFTARSSKLGTGAGDILVGKAMKIIRNL
jgi:hypothetical protein